MLHIRFLLLGSLLLAGAALIYLPQAALTQQDVRSTEAAVDAGASASGQQYDSAEATAATSQPAEVWVITIDDAIGPATSDYVMRGIDAANAAGAELIVIKMNTPGGLDAAMRDIIQKILASDVPVATWVGPQGARAASAGTYIAYASHIAAMAPATNLGAATPVQIAAPPSLPDAPGIGDLEKMSGKDKDENEDEGKDEGEGNAKPVAETATDRKMINDAVAYIIGLAELRGRNVSWAERAVRDAESLDAENAYAENVIDLIADDLDDLMLQLDGWLLDYNGKQVQLDLADYRTREWAPDLRTEILSIITNPGIILVLGMIGIYGIILEFYNPGSLIPGVIGVICLLLAAYSVQLLPLNYAGLALLTLGISLMVAEALVPSFGILGIGGIIAFSIGGLMLFDTELGSFQVGWPLILAMALLMAAAIIATIRIALKIRGNPATTGKAALIGEIAEVLEDFAGKGQVRVGGEIWWANTSEPVSAGDIVTIEAVDGLLLKVSKHEGGNS